MKLDWKDIWTRAGKTFVQAGLSCLVASLGGVNFVSGDHPENFWIGLGVSALAAGLSAAWNAVLKPIFASE